MENDRGSQKKLYSSFYGYAMAVCCRYCNRHEDAVEILNDGFLKVFRGLAGFKPCCENLQVSFKGWLRKIMIYTAIDHNRRNSNYRTAIGFSEKVVEMPFTSPGALDKISYEEIINVVQQLPPSYRTVFNLFVIEEFSHDEIAKLLGISAGTSKSNLFKAKKHLQKLLFPNRITSQIRNAV